jgi:hypothetical protein
MNSLASNFISSYWNTNGQYFMSSSVTTPDDRANAMAVLAGLAQPQHFAGIRTVLAQQTFASPYMEKYVLEALCKMNSDSLALARMKNRYTPMVNANYTTLWEVWNGLSEGTINHGWNAPNTVLSQYIAGVSPTAPGWSSYSVMPQMSQPTAISAVVPSIKGNIAVSDSLSSSQFIMNLSSPSGTKAMVGIPKKRAWQLVTVNGQAVWSQGKFCSGVAGVSEAGEDNLYIKFNVDPGASRFVASLVTIPAHRDTVFNGAFGLGTLGWTFNVWGGGAHGSVANGEYKIQIDSIAQNNSAIQLVQNGIILQQGKSYEVKFDAYASANRTLEANMEQDVNPWTSYLPALQNFNLTTTKTTYSYTFTMTNPTDSNGRVTFNAGASTKSVFIDNVSVKAISASIHSNNDLKESSVAWLSHSQLRVKFRAPQGSAISLGIFDLNGALVRSGAFRAGSGESQSWTTDLSGMPRGLYFVRVDADGNDILRSKFLYDN